MVKEVLNTVCGSLRCDNTADIRLMTKLGFAARFCSSCAQNLMMKGLATKENHGNEK